MKNADIFILFKFNMIISLHYYCKRMLFWTQRKTADNRVFYYNDN